MAIKIHVPTTLRPECGGASELVVTATTVRAALDWLQRDHAPLYRSVCDETGVVRRHVNLFVNNSLLNRREGLDIPLAPGDVLSIMPAVSGG